MIPTTAYVKFGPEGLAEVDTSLYPSEHSRFRCSVYEDRPPIFSIRDRHVSVSISVPDPDHVSVGDLATAQRLAAELDRYITGLEDWATTHATQAKAADSQAA